MKKVGILTYHNTRNFGAAFQAYALQNYIEKIGVDCEIIDYKCSVLEEKYKINKIYQNKSLKELIKWFLTVKDKKISQKKFERFFKEYYKLSSESYSLKTMEFTNAIYNVFITGSDQVWNMNITHGDNTYFLDFVKPENKKVSYAASFGYKEIPIQYEKASKNLICSIDNISVREIEGKEIIANLLNKKVEVVLDPTLLLKKNDWEKLCVNLKEEKEYILVYVVAPSSAVFSFAKKLSKIYRCKVICVHYTHNKFYGMENRCDLSPQEFLSYIKNAKFIVTSSFHGVALSINLEKEFFFGLDDNPNNYNSRIKTLVKILELENRQITLESNVENYSTINYEIVNKHLELERQKSFNFIKSFLEV